MSNNGYCQNCFERKLRVFVSPEKWNGVQSHLINTDNENFQLKEQLESEREKNRELKSWHDSTVAEYKKEREEQTQKYLDTANKYNDTVDKLIEEREKLATVVEGLKQLATNARAAITYRPEVLTTGGFDFVVSKLEKDALDLLAKIKESK